MLIAAVVLICAATVCSIFNSKTIRVSWAHTKNSLARRLVSFRWPDHVSDQKFVVLCLWCIEKSVCVSDRNNSSETNKQLNSLDFVYSFGAHEGRERARVRKWLKRYFYLNKKINGIQNVFYRLRNDRVSSSILDCASTSIVHVLSWWLWCLLPNPNTFFSDFVSKYLLSFDSRCRYLYLSFISLHFNCCSMWIESAATAIEANRSK